MRNSRVMNDSILYSSHCCIRYKLMHIINVTGLKSPAHWFPCKRGHVLSHSHHEKRTWVWEKTREVELLSLLTGWLATARRQGKKSEVVYPSYTDCHQSSNRRLRDLGPKGPTFTATRASLRPRGSTVIKTRHIRRPDSVLPSCLCLWMAMLDPRKSTYSINPATMHSTVLIP